MLEIAVLGLLNQEAMHGYQIRRVLTEMAGSVRGFSYGSLYPILNKLEKDGFIKTVQADTVPLPRRKAKKVYTVTPSGQQFLHDLLNNVTPTAFNDEDFGIRLAFLEHTSAPARRQLLEGRRRYLEERRDHLMGVVHKPSTPTAASQVHYSAYSLGLNKLALDTTQREISWVNNLIQQEEDG